MDLPIAFQARPRRQAWDPLTKAYPEMHVGPYVGARFRSMGVCFYRVERVRAARFAPACRAFRPAANPLGSRRCRPSSGCPAPHPP
jgi:hypothetical protein